MAARDLLIFPRNGNGIEALDCLGDAWHLLGFVHDDVSMQGTDCWGHAVHARSALARHPDAAVLAVPGSPTSFRERRAVIEGLGLDPRRFARVIHPGARVSPLARLGHNVLVMAGAVVTSNAVIGNHVCILPNSVIHHDVRIGDWSLVCANVTVGGGTRIGENCYIGSGSRIRNGLEIGDGALIGLGSCVIRDVHPGSTVAGTPARELAERTGAHKTAGPAHAVPTN